MSVVRAHPTVPFNFSLRGRILSRQKITIIGAGPVGLLCAYFAHKAGFSVRVVAPPVAENNRCSGLNAGGMLAPAYEFMGLGNHEIADFALSSRYKWRELANEIGIAINPTSYAVAASSLQTLRLNQIWEEGNLRGFDWSRLCPKGIDDDNNWLELGCDALINPVSVHSQIYENLCRSGVEFVEASIQELKSTALTTDEGELSYENLIIAAGVGSKVLQNSLSELRALVPVRGQLLELDVISPLHGTLRMGSSYILCRGDKTIVGATMQRGDEDWNPRSADASELLNPPHELPFGLDQVQITKAFCGVRPGTIDDLPLVGKSSINNVFLACGAYRNGWLLAPKIAEDLINLIKTDENRLPKSFFPNRFGF